jgi:hypothetical protein
LKDFCLVEALQKNIFCYIELTLREKKPPNLPISVELKKTPMSLESLRRTGGKEMTAILMTP